MDHLLFNENSIVSANTSGTTVQEAEEHEESKRMNDRTLWSQAEYKGFDGNAGRNYVYPKNTDKHQYREYQYKICKEAFFQNTLVVLPDGLGKSFIASVVMYNIYRWYPMSKVIFLSANKSILRAQMEACSNIMNIPKGDCVEITGN
uniref:Helicase/UvrB N-terminal domain-containing protein n=1 Tax=Lutzomyia longipalpis TaxID=7200 RepID=A0A1B0GK40_LUTLO